MPMPWAILDSDLLIYFLQLKIIYYVLQYKYKILLTVAADYIIY